MRPNLIALHILPQEEVTPLYPEILLRYYKMILQRCRIIVYLSCPDSIPATSVSDIWCAIPTIHKKSPNLGNLVLYLDTELPMQDVDNQVLTQTSNPSSIPLIKTTGNKEEYPYRGLG